MTQTITRIYESRQHAADAVRDLTEAGITADQYHLVDHPGGEHDEASAAMSEALMARNVIRYRAVTYAREVVQGGSILIVYAPWGMGATAERIVAAYNPIGPVDPDADSPPLKEWDEAAPLSSAMGGWTTKYDEPTPISKFMGMPVLVDGGKLTTASWGWRLLSDKPYTFPNWKQLSDNATPLSTKLGMPLLSAGQYVLGWLPMLTSMRDMMNPPKLIAGTKHFFTMFPLLSEKQLSSTKLSDDPTPLSSKLGLPLLSAKQHVMAWIPMIAKGQASLPSVLKGSVSVTSMFPMLSKNQLSNTRLSNEAAPFSAKLSWPTLSAKQAFSTFMPLLAKADYTLSSALGIPLLLKQPEPKA